MKEILYAVTFAMALFALAGCQTNRQLEPGGPYEDIVLFQADSIIDQTVITMEALQGWAKRNPTAVMMNQEVDRLLKTVNAELDGVAQDGEILVEAVRARDAYELLSNQTTANDLQMKLRLVTELSRQILPILFPDGEI